MFCRSVVERISGVPGRRGQLLGSLTAAPGPDALALVAGTAGYERWPLFGPLLSWTAIRYECRIVQTITRPRDVLNEQLILLVECRQSTVLEASPPSLRFWRVVPASEPNQLRALVHAYFYMRTRFHSPVVNFGTTSSRARVCFSLDGVQQGISYRQSAEGIAGDEQVNGTFVRGITAGEFGSVEYENTPVAEGARQTKERVLAGIFLKDPWCRYRWSLPHPNKEQRNRRDDLCSVVEGKGNVAGYQGQMKLARIKVEERLGAIEVGWKGMPKSSRDPSN
ncbi:hypothetical protein DFH09DRAFT_1272956 [Mycena vulgaris]|nr:hypothetical protein DFH09DRAFT_1272956 [Mycena vulgaris]